MIRIPKELLDSIEVLHLPPAPQILLKFIHLSENDAASMPELAALLKQDPALTARILTVSNSVAFLKGKPTHNLVKCLVNLGLRLSRTLAACLVVQNVFTPTIKQKRYEYEGFWQHSLSVAELCRYIADDIHYPDPEEAYLAGLMHDIGELLLLGGIETSYSTILDSCQNEQILYNREEHLLGTNHSVVSAWLIEQWGLSSSFMVDAVMFHHATAKEIITADPLSQILWSAHLFSSYRLLFQATEQIYPDELKTVYELLGLDFAKLSCFYSQSSQNVRMIFDALGLNLADELRTMPYCTRSSGSHLPDGSPAALSEMEESVQNMALMQQLYRDISAVKDESELLLPIAESSRILFGLGAISFLMLREDKAVLSGKGINFQAELMQKMETRIDPPKSLAALSLVKGEPVFSLASEDSRNVPALFDIQVARILGTEGVLYIPLNGGKRVSGVMVCGICSRQIERIKGKIKWIKSFARAAAINIESWGEIQRQRKEQESLIARRFEQSVRKTIHEAGNPLGIIKNYLAIMSSKVSSDSDLLHELQIMKEEIERVTRIMKGMSSLHETIVSNGQTDANELIDGMLFLYKELLFTSRGIEVALDLDPQLPAIKTDGDVLKQILLNLWNNASEALESGDRVTVSTAGDINQDGVPFIEIRVADNGPGLPEDVTKRIFKPLEANRRIGHSGLGLSIVAELVKSLEGRISCQSRKGMGVIFSIMLPKGQVPADE